MSIESEIVRLEDRRNVLRNKLITLGLINDGSADLSDCVAAINSVSSRNQNDVTRISYVITIPSGLYNTNTTVNIPTYDGSIE